MANWEAVQPITNNFKSREQNTTCTLQALIHVQMHRFVYTAKKYGSLNCTEIKLQQWFVKMYKDINLTQKKTHLLRPVQQRGPQAAPKCAQWHRAWACPGQRAGHRAPTGLSAGWGAPHSGGRTPAQKTHCVRRRSTRTKEKKTGIHLCVQRLFGIQKTKTIRLLSMHLDCNCCCRNVPLSATGKRF